MDLNEYLWKNRVTQKTFSKTSGLSPRTINFLVHKTFSPSLVSALNVYEATGGDVTFFDMLKDSDVKKLAKKKHKIEKSLANKKCDAL